MIIMWVCYFLGETVIMLGHDSLSLHLVFRFQFMFHEIVSSTITCTNDSFSYPLCKAKDPALLKS